jgi:hypothetical protein
MPNKTILLGGAVIIGVGVIRAATNNKPETPVFAGGVAFLLLASLLDALGGGASKVATALVALAATTVVVVEASGVFAATNNVLSKARSTTF